MSELKARKLFEAIPTSKEGFYQPGAFVDGYLKSEADKVIANLEESHKTEVKELLCLIRDKENNFNRAFDSEEKEIRHHKYKRYLAMAKLCKLKRIDAANYRIPREKWEFYDKWCKRWQELAEKFKEAK